MSTLWGGSFQIYHYGSLRWLHIVSDVLLLLTGVAPYHFSCLTAANWIFCTLSQVSLCRSLWWLHIISYVPLPLNLLLFILSNFPWLLMELVTCHLWDPTAIQLGLLCVVPVFQFPLPGVVPCHLTCFTVTP